MISHDTHGMFGRLAKTGWAVRWCLVLILVLPWAGCGRRGDAPIGPTAVDTAADSRFTSTSLSPRAIIDEVVHTYQSLHAYHDQASVVLRYHLEGESQEERAPLAVAWEAGGALGLDVYSLKAGPQQGRWRLRIDRPDMQIEDQVLSRAIPDKVDFTWLLSDPYIGQALSAGLAGFPPQLDLLLSPKPLSGLVNERATLAFDPQTTLDGRACHVIRVTQAGVDYRLFIDQASLLLRRLDLPRANLPREMLGDPRITQVHLSIEFENQHTQGPIDWQQFQVSLSAGDRLVNHFVPRPPTLETRGLGIKVPSFRLENAAGQTAFRALVAEEASSESKPVKVLMWLADHPASKVAAEQLARVALRVQREAPLKEQIQFVCVWAEPGPPEGETFGSLATHWNLPGQLTIDRAAMGRDLFDIQEAPSLVVLDGNNRVQLIERAANPLLDEVLPEILSRIVRGDDVAQEIQAEMRSMRARHAAQLRAATAIDGQPAEPSRTSAYEPQLLELRQVRSIPHPVSATALAATVDPQQRTWTLHADGSLIRAEVLQDAAHETMTTRPVELSSPRLTIAPDGRFAAVGGPMTNELQLVDFRKQEVHRMHLPAEAKLVDFQWLQLHGDRQSRLAALTGTDLLLLDPTNHEQLSGTCPDTPQALIANADRSLPVEGLVVLANRRVEPIALSDESTHRQNPLLGRPASYAADAEVKTFSLPFQPRSGPWSSWQDADGRRTLAQGWLAQDEPVLYMLNEKLAPLWHYRVGLQPAGTPPPQMSVARDPATAMAAWLVLDASQSLHVLRSDGLTDHFQLDNEVVAANLLTRGDQLLLVVTQPESTVVYAMRWRQ